MSQFMRDSGVKAQSGIWIDDARARVDIGSKDYFAECSRFIMRDPESGSR